MFAVVRQPRSTVRERILAATVHCLVREGYAGTSTPKVVREAEVSRGALLHHFPTREALFVATAEYVVTHWLAGMEELFANLAADPSPRTASEVILAELEDERFVAFLELVAAARTVPALSATLLEAYDRFAATVAAGARRVLPEVPPERIGVALRLFLHYLEGVALHASMGVDRASVARDLDFWFREVLPRILGR